MSGTQERRLVGAIEGGGTKFVCAIAATPGTILERAVVATRDPVSTLRDCLQFLSAAAARHGRLDAVGVAAFGPLQLRSGAQDYGRLLDTPKVGWSGADVMGPFRDTLRVPVALDTDVGAAARGELAAAASSGVQSLAYITVGTGIGGAVAPSAAGRRLLHAEMGHLAVRRDPRDADFPGTCPFHRDCLEGLASGPAILARWGVELSALPPDHPGREIIAGYLGQLVTAILLLHSPECVIIGGGVTGDAALLPAVRVATIRQLAGYLPPLRDPGAIEGVIRAPALGADAAIAGAVRMAFDLLERPGEDA